MQSPFFVSLTAATVALVLPAAHLNPASADPAKTIRTHAVQVASIDERGQTNRQTATANDLSVQRLAASKLRTRSQSDEPKKKKKKCYPPYETKKCPLKPFTK